MCQTCEEEASIRFELKLDGVDVFHGLPFLKGVNRKLVLGIVKLYYIV